MGEDGVKQKQVEDRNNRKVVESPKKRFHFMFYNTDTQWLLAELHLKKRHKCE